MAASPTMMFHSKKAPTLCTELSGIIMLRFQSPEMELAYQEELLDSSMHTRSRRLLVLAGIGLLSCVNYGFGHGDMQWAARVASLCISAFFAAYAWVSRRDPNIVGFHHGWIMLASYCYVAFIVSLTRDRWAKLMQSEGMRDCLLLSSGAQDGRCSVAGLMEASCIFSLSGLLNLSAFFTQMPTGHCFLLLNFAVLAYLCLAWGLGSLEFQLMDSILDEDDGWEHNRMVHHCVLAMGLYTLGILTVASRRGLELKDRRAFASAYLKLVKREWEAREDRKAVARQNELEQRLHALMTPMGSDENACVGSQTESEDSEGGRPRGGSDRTGSLTIEQQRSMQMRVANTLSRSDKLTDSNHLSVSDGTQGSVKSKSKSLFGSPVRSRKSKEIYHEDPPWLKTVPPPPVWQTPPTVPEEAAGIADGSQNSTVVTAATSMVTPATPGEVPTVPASSSAIPPSPKKRSSMLVAPTIAGEGSPRRQSLAGQRLVTEVKPPNTRLVTSMAGHAADLPRIRRMAERIRQPDYNLLMFFQDCVASFPELSLFTSGDDGNNGRMTASGRSAEVEYQRTVGALFAVYWLMRLDTDGKEAFCYGVDDDWIPRGPPEVKPAGNHLGPMVPIGSMSRSIELLQSRVASTSGGEVMTWRSRRRSIASAASEAPPPAKKLFSQMTAEEKRTNFMTSASWSQFQELVNQAGCGDDNPNRIDNIIAMLCLTSFHDIMKVEELLPVVQPQHAPYNGYQAGITIQDHDCALAYVLEHFPEVLPSFGGLHAAAKELIIFSQGKMHFNHGWFVQAEAPPGAMLSKFKQVLSNGASPRHVGFYFFHWITDLAGAEATPLGGAEKFVLKFPHDVLASFLWSMPFLGKLVNESETAVVESYLKERWRMLSPEMPLPAGKTAVAVMRLAVMVQQVESTLQAFDELAYQEMKVLSEELARTGVKDQYYTECKMPGGPSFLVYYGPALIHQNCHSLEDLALAMLVLGRVLGAARKLWPLQSDCEASTVTIQVSELKSKSLLEITGSPAADTRQVWILIRQNDNDGTVMLRQASDLNYLFSSGQQFVVLDFCSRSPFLIEDDTGRRRSRTASEESAAKKATPAAKAKASPQVQEPPPAVPSKQEGAPPGTAPNGSPRERRGSNAGHNTTGSCSSYQFMPCVPSATSSMSVAEGEGQQQPAEGSGAPPEVN